MTRQPATPRPAISLEMDAESVRPFMRSLIQSGRVKLTIECEHGSAFGVFDILAADKGGKTRRPTIAICQLVPMTTAFRKATKKEAAKVMESVKLSAIHLAEPLPPVSSFDCLPCRAATNIVAAELGECLRCGAANGQSCLAEKGLSK